MTHEQAGPSANGHSNGALNGRLDGWKEIAAYLGRSVRTAQRWERELGLPIHRLGTGAAETVYALKEQLDAWVLRQSRFPSADLPPAPAPVEASSEPRWRWSWLAPAGAALVMAVAGAWALWRAPNPAQSAEPPDPASLEIVGNTLRAHGPRHELLWSHSFDVPLDDLDPSTDGGRTGLKLRSAIGDFRGTGHNDVVLARNTPKDPRLYWFDPAGRVVRTHRVDRDVSFGRQRCTTIRFSRLFTNVDPSDRLALWIAGHELAGNFPAVLQSLDSAGRIRSEYWSAGFIGAVAVVVMNGRRLVLVGSAANETGGAALAVFDGGANGSSPAADEAYRCAGCPPGMPRHYLVFPRSRLQAELGNNAQVVEISAASGGMVRIRVVHAGDPDSGGSTGSAYYTLDSAFRISAGELNSDVAPIQRKYEAEHLATAATRPRGAADLYPVLRWNGQGYSRIDGPEVR